MKHLRFFMFIVPFVVSCSHSDETLFRSRVIQDSLEVFISCVESIPNPYDAPTIINVNMGLSPDRDTIVSFTAHYGLVYPVDSNYEMIGSILGATIINGRVIVVHSEESLLDDMINTNQLDLSEKEYDFLGNYDGPYYDIDTYPSSRRRYIIHERSLIEYERQVGQYEK